MTYAVKQERISHQQARIERHSDQSASNTPLVLTIPAGGTPRRIDRISGAYSAPVSKSITIAVVSGAGSAYNETLPPIVITADVQGSFVPSTDMWLSGDDGLVITAPSGDDGVRQIETATVVGTISPGVKQVKTVTVAETVPGTLTSGTIHLTVTAAGMTGSPRTIAVPVTTNETEAQLAATIAGVAAADTFFNVFFDVTNPGGAPTTVVFTAKAAAADDVTMNVALADPNGLGMTPVVTADSTAAGVISGTGNATVIVTAAGMTASPITTGVAVVASDTATQVAGKIQTALALNATIAAFFAIGGTGATVKLTRAIEAADDSSINIDVDNGTCTGLTDEPASVHTLAGVLGITVTSTLVARLEEAGM